MRHWFLSYHSPDQALAARVKAALERKDMDAHVFFAPSRLRAGGFWSKTLAEEIARADAFILLVGETGVGDWQVLEYDEALDKRVKLPDFPVILVLLEGQTAPGLPFLRRLHWIVTADPASENDVARLIDATAGTGTRLGELWRYTSPYRGLAAMEEKDGDYFFGRERETVDVLSALAAAADRLPLLIGNSGVGKSSLAQAGVLAALKRQAFPDDAQGAGPWPEAFRDSRRWVFLKLQPGAEPLRALVEPFLATWRFEATDPQWESRLAGWVKTLADEEALRGWVAAEREFLIWKAALEADRRVWEGAPEGEKTDALLMGLALAQAQGWLAKRAEDLPRSDRGFIDLSLRREAQERAQRERLRRQRTWVAAAAFVLVAGFATFAGWQWREAHRSAVRAEQEKTRAEANFAAAKQTVNDLIFDVAQGLQDVVGMRAETVRRILQTVERTINNLVLGAPSDLDLQRSRSVMLNNFGDVYRRTGDLARALQAYEEALTIARRLSTSDPVNAKWQHDVWVSLVKIGEVQLTTGNRAGALQAYGEALDVARRLMAVDPDNAEWRRSVSVTFERIGDARRAAGDRAGALQAYEEALPLARLVAAVDPANADWQRGVSVSLEKVGDM